MPPFPMRVLLKGTVVVGVLLLLSWMNWPRIQAALAEHNAARNRQRNHLPSAALSALRQDPHLILYSLNPKVDVRNSPGAPMFQKRAILGQTEVAAPADRLQLAQTLEEGLRAWRGKRAAACFSPRHALRASDGVNTHDFLICFECGRLEYSAPGIERLSLVLPASADHFNRLLITAGVTLSRPPAAQ